MLAEETKVQRKGLKVFSGGMRESGGEAEGRSGHC